MARLLSAMSGLQTGKAGITSCCEKCRILLAVRKENDIIEPLPPLDLVWKGGVFLMIQLFLSFVVAVAAGVACHYIIKWLDGDE